MTQPDIPFPAGGAATTATAQTVMTGWSIEATLPKPAEIEGLASRLDRGAAVFLSTLPHVSLDRQIETARIVADNGLDPVLHIAARYYATRTELVGYLARANREAGAARVLVIGGDLDRPRGEFDSALDLIRSGLLADYGVRRVGIAAYPEGHPTLAGATLAAALEDKLAALADLGHEAEIVTQFCFDPGPVLAWLKDFRARQPAVDVRIGMAGPTSAKTLARYALRCGVNTPFQGIGRKLTMASQLLRTVTPDGIVGALDRELGSMDGTGGISAHFFSFGGIEETAAWALARAAA